MTLEDSLRPGVKLQSNDKITSYFSQSQVALALIIHKSKPEELSTSEYCEQLRKYIKTGKPPSTENLRYIDTVEFWKDQYTKLHKQNKELQEKIEYLEQFQIHNAYNDQSNDGRSVTFEHYIQRLQSSVPMGNDSSPRPRSYTVPKIEELNRIRNNPDSEPLAKEELINFFTIALRLRRQRNQLEKASTDIETLVHIENLATLTCQGLGATESILWNSFQPYWFLKTRKSQVLQVFHYLNDQIVMLFLACFDALNELCNTIHGRAYKYEVSYRMVKFFQKSLDLLHTCSRMQAKHEGSLYQDIIDKNSSSVEYEYIVNKITARCLTSILENLDLKPKNIAHSEIWEGILFSILDHTGRLISETVFSEHVAASESPGNITSSTGLTPEVTMFESKYVVQVLQAALAGENKKRIVTGILCGKSKQDSRSNLMESNMLPKDLLSRATLLLQSTLVKSALGSDDLESLKLPILPVKEVDFILEEKKEKYGPEWFLENVWAIIGWDLVT